MYLILFILILIIFVNSNSNNNENFTINSNKCNINKLNKYCNNHFGLCDRKKIVSNKNDCINNGSLEEGGKCFNDYNCNNLFICRNNKCIDRKDIKIKMPYQDQDQDQDQDQEKNKKDQEKNMKDKDKNRRKYPVIILF